MLRSEGQSIGIYEEEAGYKDPDELVPHGKDGSYYPKDEGSIGPLEGR